MGCHQHHTTDTIYNSFVPSLEQIYMLDSFNEEMIKNEIVLQELEEVRFNYSRALGNMLYDSGAIVAKKANLSHALIAVLYITSRDLTSDVFSYLIISKHKPIVKFLEGCSPSASIIQTKTDIDNYVEECEKTIISMMTIGNHISYINKSFEKNLPRWKQEHSILVKNDPIELTIFDQKLFKIREKLKRAYLLSNEIITKSSNYQNEIDFVIGKLQNEREKERYFTIFRKIHNDHLKNKNDYDNRTLYLNNMTPNDTFNNQWKTLYNNNIINNRLSLSYAIPKNGTSIKPHDIDTNLKPVPNLEVKKISTIEDIHPTLEEQYLPTQLSKPNVEEEIKFSNDKVIETATEPLQCPIPVFPLKVSDPLIQNVDETSTQAVKRQIPIPINDDNYKPTNLQNTIPIQVNNLDSKNMGNIINQHNINKTLQDTIPINYLQDTKPILASVEKSQNLPPKLSTTAELERICIPVIPLKDRNDNTLLYETSHINTLPYSENLMGTLPVVPLQAYKPIIPFSDETTNLPLQTTIPIPLDGVKQGDKRQNIKPVDLKIEDTNNIPTVIPPLQGTMPVILKPQESVNPTVIPPLQGTIPVILKPQESINPTVTPPLQGTIPVILKPQESVIPKEDTNLSTHPHVKTPLQGTTPVILLPNNVNVNPFNNEITNIPLQTKDNKVLQGTIPVILVNNKEQIRQNGKNDSIIYPKPEKQSTLQGTIPVVRLQGTKPIILHTDGTSNAPLCEPSSTDEFSHSKKLNNRYKSVNNNEIINKTMQQLQTTLPISSGLGKTQKEEVPNQSKFKTEDKIKKIEQLTKLTQSLEDETNAYKRKTEKTTVFYVNQFLPIKSWNISLVNSIMVPENDLYVKCICMNYENNQVYFGTKSGKIHNFDLNTFEFLSSIQAHDLSVRSLYYINDGCSVISGGVDGKLIKWSITQGRREEFIRNPACGSIRCITSMMNGEKIFVASGTYIECYNLLNMREEPNSALSMNSIVTCVMWNKEHQLLVAGLKNGEVIFVKPQIKSVVAQFRDHLTKINSMAYCSYLNHHSVATCSKDNIIRIYNLDERVMTYTVDSYSKKNYFPKHVIYGYDEKSLFTAHEDGKIFVVDYTKRGKKKYYFVKKSPISAFFYCGDGCTIITGNKNSQIDIFIAN